MTKDSSTDRLDMVLQTFDRLKTMKRDSPTAYKMLLTTLKNSYDQASTNRAIEELEALYFDIMTDEISTEMGGKFQTVTDRINTLKKGLSDE